MPITRYPYPNALPTEQNDYVAQNNLLEVGFMRVNDPAPIDFTGGLVLQGAVFQCGGTVYLCDADTAIGGAASLYVKLTPAGGGATLVPSYVANLAGVTWSQAHNGYYDVGGNLYVFDEGRAMQNGEIAAVVGRYVMQDRSGDAYVGRDVKPGRNIDFTEGGDADHEIKMASDASLLWDESEDQFTPNKGFEIYDTDTGTLLKTVENGTELFYLKKPISAYTRLYNNAASPSSGLYIYQNGNWRTVAENTAIVDLYNYNFHLCPGYYKLYSNKASVVAYLYCTGVYGTPAMTVADIIT